LGGRAAIFAREAARISTGQGVIHRTRQKGNGKALSPKLTLEEDDDPRIQIYRTSMDSFLTWLSLVASGLNQGLFLVANIEEVGYWVSKIQSERIVHGFIVAYGYEERFMTLVKAFRRKRNPYRNWYFFKPEVTPILRKILRSGRKPSKG
jgi:hypothetical protein